MLDLEPAIGIFDSGVGGLTVVRRVAERLPDEAIVYLGDTARVPYGTKSPDTVIRYALACSRKLIEHDIKLLVVACNTASSCALDALRDEYELPVVGVVEPGAETAVAQSKTGRIGVIGTPRTIATGHYEEAIHALNPDAQVFAKACPLFVPLAEEGWTTGPVPESVAAAYLEELIVHDIDTLVLGCTHYPLLADVIQRVVGPSVTLVDSAEATARTVAETLEAMNLLALSRPETRRHFLVSDEPNGFALQGSRFLNQALASVEWVDV